MAMQTLVSFEGLSEGAAEKLAVGLAAVASARLSEIMNKSAEISTWSDEDVHKLSSLVSAAASSGNCGWGCNGT